MRPDLLPTLMQRRVEQILLVSSPYDAFTLEEDGLLTEMIFQEYADLGLSHAPAVTRAANGQEALEFLGRQRFDLVITMSRLADMDVLELRRAIRAAAPDVPVVLLASSDLEWQRLRERGAAEHFNPLDVCVWEGDPKLFLALIKSIEDRWNVAYDTDAGSVGVIILVEDSVRYRSTFLPIMYGELVRQTRRVLAESLNRAQKLLRMRARPKILVADNFEDGLRLFNEYREHLFGVISDVQFARNGASDPRAGISLIRAVKAENEDIPCLLQSSDLSNRRLADEVHAFFLYKRSRTLLADLADFMLRNFGFGSFEFRDQGNLEVARADDLRGMVQALQRVPLSSIERHARRNHFSVWLRARGEFALAQRLRPRRVSEFQDLEALRTYLVTEFEQAIRRSHRGVIEDFVAARYDSSTTFARIGGGSLGGKARGLAFVDALLARGALEQRFPEIQIHVPRAVVIGADVFEAFLEKNRVRTSDLFAMSDEHIAEFFMAGVMPPGVESDLRMFLSTLSTPLAVRSSSLLEDSLHYPFAGIYETRMLANRHEDGQDRLDRLASAVKLIFASTFFREARRYVEATPHALEAQRMAVIIQEIVGSERAAYFYPSFSGVVRSYNFYPFGHMKPEDGVASVALGLGRTIVEGGAVLRFCPAFPHVLPQLDQGEKYIDQSQRHFYAVNLSCNDDPRRSDAVVRLDLQTAEEHGTLAPIGSVWSDDSQCFYDGVYHAGARVVTFAHILKSDLFPLAAVLRELLELGRVGLGGPVEIEFAVDLVQPKPRFAVLQIRPYEGGSAGDVVNIPTTASGQTLCKVDQALGNGVLRNIADVIYVRPDSFDSGQTPRIAAEVAAINERLRIEKRECLLIGPGRWGSSNAWLGVPVSWSQISTARVIVETALPGYIIDPSQGSHFFHNLVSLGVMYLTCTRVDAVDWNWLDSQPVESDGVYVRHVRLNAPLEVRADGRSSQAVILKVPLAAAAY